MKWIKCAYFACERAYVCAYARACIYFYVFSIFVCFFINWIQANTTIALVTARLTLHLPSSRQLRESMLILMTSVSERFLENFGKMHIQQRILLFLKGDEYNNDLFRMEHTAPGVWSMTIENIGAINDLGRILEDLLGTL